jgi:alkaline phosphatase
MGLPWLRRAIWAFALIHVTACTPDKARSRPARHTGMDSAIDADPGDSGDAAAVNDAASRPPRELARNIIVFMGDGMGPEQLAAGRFAAGGRLRIDAMAGPARANTDSLSTLRIGGADAPPTDSAAAATVIATGVLVENDVLSQGPDGQPIETVLEICKRAGKATGLITTALFFDASPAAFASHQLSRSAYPEIAREMLSVTQSEVIMGSGAWLFDAPDSDLPLHAEQGGYKLLRSANALAAGDPSSPARLLGLFETDFTPLVSDLEPLTMTPELERTASSPDPSLAIMTQRAIERLSQDPDGFFLFAEDEIFDEIGHRGPSEVAWANRALPAQVAGLDAAVTVAIDWVRAHSSFDDTLIVLLADHETGGYHFDHALGPSSGDFAAYVEDGALRAGVHTRTPTEVYALGPGSESVHTITSHADTHRLLLGMLPQPTGRKE